MKNYQMKNPIGIKVLVLLQKMTKNNPQNEIRRIRRAGNNQRIVNLPKTFNFGDFVVIQKIKVPEIKIKEANSDC